MDTQYRSDDEIFTEIGVFDSLQLLRNLSDWGLYLLQKSEKDVNRATFEREGRVIVAEKVDIDSIPG